MLRLDRAISRLALGLALGSTALSAGACRSERPEREGVATEKLLVTRVASAPALSEPLPRANADRAVTWGEAYFVRARRPELAWAGQFEGRIEQRTGLVELVRTATDAPRFAFDADFLEADVPTAAWLCPRMALGRSVSASECADRLRRTVATESTLLAYVPCWQPDCPIAELEAGVVHGSTVPALSEVRVVALDERPIVLAWSHWIRSRQWTGESLVVMRLAPPLERVGEISLSETDARDPNGVVYFLGRLEILADGLRVTGRRSVRDRISNRELSGADVDERFGLGADGKLEKR
ncbi:MAG: hypothetical protein HY908_37685 [Myxococcales bacterium]|nr:hypothetical protein [Myxococcales bacterium]